MRVEWGVKLYSLSTCMRVISIWVFSVNLLSAWDFGKCIVNSGCVSGALLIDSCECSDIFFSCILIVFLYCRYSRLNCLPKCYAVSQLKEASLIIEYRPSVVDLSYLTRKQNKSKSNVKVVNLFYCRQSVYNHNVGCQGLIFNVSCYLPPLHYSKSHCKKTLVTS